MKRSIITVIVAVVAAPWCAAQGFDQLPPGKWWEDPRLAQRISLTADQRQRIHELVYDHALIMIDLKADVDRSELGLRQQVDHTPLDSDAVRKAFAHFQTARQRLESERFEMLLAVRQVLKAEQWQELQQLRHEFERRRARAPGDGPPRPQGRRLPGPGPG